jgi:hypothetical protein
MPTPRTYEGHQTSLGDHIIDDSCSNATTTVPDDSQAGSMISAMRAIFDKALNKDGYTDNAFRRLINSGTPPLDSLNILLASHLVTEEKNKAFRPWKSALLQVHQADASAMDTFELLTLMIKCPTWCEVSEDDIRSRGGYVHPMTLQTIGKDGTVQGNSYHQSRRHRSGDKGRPTGRGSWGTRGIQRGSEQALEDLGGQQDARGI